MTGPHLMAPIASQVTPTRRFNFFNNLVDQIKSELSKDEKLQTDWKELKKLSEEADALKKAQQAKEELAKKAAETAEKTKEGAGEVLGKTGKVTKDVFGKVSASTKYVKDKVKETTGSAAETIKKTTAESEFIKEADEFIKNEQQAFQSTVEETLKTDYGQAAAEAASQARERAQRVKGKVDHGKEKVKETIDGVKGTSAYQQVTREVSHTTHDLFMDTTLEGRVGTPRPEPKIDITPNMEDTGITVAQKSEFSKKFDALFSKIEDTAIYNRIQDARDAIKNSDNLVLRGARAVGSSVAAIPGRLFPENAQAEATREIRMIDPNFTIPGLLRHLKKDMIHQVSEAMVKQDLKVLKEHCSEGQLKRLQAAFKLDQDKGRINASRVLDIRTVDFVSAQIVDDDVRVYISFGMNQTKHYKDKSGATVEGAEDDIQFVFSVWGLRMNTDDPSRIRWEIVEFVNHGVAALI
eukprot:TRINITY_DN1556_c0_g1_i2.p1 TRINITY_DN1556_c0_g1~~TRINITY_DN1556_c0_g1_i2.p1  ORF type:complete len:466 (-),score=162.69 TRINITY_DN1556_c0_g1_i2:126-1523(-)